MESEQEKTQRYFRRVAELRETAAQVEDNEVRTVLLKAAEAYERMIGWNPRRN